MCKVLFSERITNCGLQKKLWEIMSDFNDWPMSVKREAFRLKLNKPLKLKQPFEIKGALELAIDELNQIHKREIFDLSQIIRCGTQKQWLSSIEIKYYFDLIELQYRQLPHEMQVDFRKRINCCLSEFLPEFYLYPQGNIGRTIPLVLFGPDEKQILKKTPEEELYELLQRAITYHHQPDESSRKEAAKVLWDAFERLKSYIGGVGGDKKESTNRLIRLIAGDDKNLNQEFNQEFEALTDIGNRYFIRHSEMNQAILKDIRLYDYLFNRCLSLILLAISNLKNRESFKETM